MRVRIPINNIIVCVCAAAALKCGCVRATGESFIFGVVVAVTAWEYRESLNKSESKDEVVVGCRVGGWERTYN